MFNIPQAQPSDTTPEPNYTVYATNRYRHNKLHPVRQDVVGFGVPTASSIYREVGKLRIIFQVTWTSSTRAPLYVGGIQKYAAHASTHGAVAMDGSPVHPGWPMHHALWKPRDEIAFKILGSARRGHLSGVLATSCPATFNLCACGWDWDYSAVMEIRPFRIRA